METTTKNKSVMVNVTGKYSGRTGQIRAKFVNTDKYKFITITAKQYKQAEEKIDYVNGTIILEKVDGYTSWFSYPDGSYNAYLEYDGMHRDSMIHD